MKVRGCWAGGSPLDTWRITLCFLNKIKTNIYEPSILKPQNNYSKSHHARNLALNSVICVRVQSSPEVPNID